MNDAERQTRSHLMELLSSHGLRPRTDLGQNFLIDLNLIEFIVREAQIVADDVLLEIGCGTGGMTTFLAKDAGHVISVEIDPRMYALAQQATEHCGNVTLLHCDALKNKNNISPRVLDAVAEQLAVDPARKLKLVANLPYNVATPVISNLVATDLPWIRMVATIQWELAQRMAARAGRSHYGALSAWLQAQCRLKVLKRLPPQVFWPRPKVHSAIIRISPDAQRRGRIRDREFLHEFLRGIFQQRRKLLRGVLAGMYRRQLTKPDVDRLMESAGLGAQTRAEELGPETLVSLANTIYEIVSEPEARSEPAVAPDLASE